MFLSRLEPIAWPIGLLLSFSIGACTGLNDSDRGSCDDDQDCALAFGGGSVCVVESGLCSEPDACDGDNECVTQFGPGWTCSAAACFGPDENATINVSGFIDADQTWTATNTYVLTEEVYVRPGVVLTIEAGTQILGQQGGALIVLPGGQLQARGTELAPIVFTSAQPVGSRASGDWAGVALMGNATTNQANPELEGLADADLAKFGGLDDTWSCGVLEYVRIEFAGFALRLDEELNGLTLAGCGSGTIIDHFQSHFGKDDGIEIFGGTVDLKHIVITRAQDDSLDWDYGWRGTAQFVAIQQDANGDHGFEASSSSEPGLTPQATPRIYNVTMLGSFTPGSTRAMKLKDGTGGTIRNVIAMGHGKETIDVEDVETVQALQNGTLSVGSSLFFQAGTAGDHYYPTVEEETNTVEDPEADNDMGFDEDAFFRAEPSIILGMSPALAAPQNLTAPGWTPSAEIVNTAGTTPPNGDGKFDDGASYVGAFAIGQTEWTTGWTAYPAN